MKAYRVAMLRKELPFIDRLFVDWEGRTTVWPEDVDSIVIKRGDENLLARTGWEDSYSWSGGGHCHYLKYFAVTGEEVVRLSHAGNSSSGSGSRSEWEAASVGEQLFQQGLVPDWVVECRKKDTDDNGSGRVERRWVIYKMARFDLAGYPASRSIARRRSSRRRSKPPAPLPQQHSMVPTLHTGPSWLLQQLGPALNIELF